MLLRRRVYVWWFRRDTDVIMTGISLSCPLNFVSFSPLWFISCIMFFYLFSLIPTVHSFFFLLQQLLLLWDVLHVASGVRFSFFCHHPTERSLQTARFWAGCALSFPSFENRLVHSSPYYTAYLTSSMELRARESRCLAQTGCMYTWSSGRVVHLVVGDHRFLFMFSGVMNRW